MYHSLGTPELPACLWESLKYPFNDLVAKLFSQFWIARPPAAEIAKGLVFPWCEDCDRSVALQAIGIIGATITPHNLYLHSGLVKVSTCFQNHLHLQEFNFKAGEYYKIDSKKKLFRDDIIRVHLYGLTNISCTIFEKHLLLLIILNFHKTWLYLSYLYWVEFVMVLLM